MMERLTEWNGSTYMAKDVLDYATPEILDRLGEYEDIGCTPEKLKQIDEWYSEMCRELGEYKRLEEQGLILRLPCPIESTVYLICSRYTKCTEYDQEKDDYSCQGCECLECDSHKEYYIHVNNSVSLQWIVRSLKDFGTTVFLTKEEAEQALAEMK